ncbi:MAG: hypothetical protein RIK87_03035 [Fuerstiella sp.]
MNRLLLRPDHTARILLPLLACLTQVRAQITAPPENLKLDPFYVKYVSAEGVQSWFNNNRPPDHDHNHVDTRQELRDYDPGLADLCKEVFGDTRLVYTRPATRLKGHLQGFDPAQSPSFVWPERLNEARRKIRAKAEQRR